MPTPASGGAAAPSAGGGRRWGHRLPVWRLRQERVLAGRPPVTKPRVVPGDAAPSGSHTLSHPRLFLFRAGALARVVGKSWAPSNGRSTKCRRLEIGTEEARVLQRGLLPTFLPSGTCHHPHTEGTGSWNLRSPPGPTFPGAGEPTPCPCPALPPSFPRPSNRLTDGLTPALLEPWGPSGSCFSWPVMESPK